MSAFIARILVIDDQPTSVGLLMAYLQDSDIDLLIAQNAKDGMRIAAEGQPDLILLDVLMPGTDGFAICRQLKEDTRTVGIPVIFLSAAIETEDKLRGFAAGGADYITKPFSEQEVLARIFLQLGERPRLEALSRQLLDGTRDVPLSASAERRDRRIFAEAVAILTKQLVEPPCVVELAHQVGTNQQRLTRIFRQQIGMSAHEYLQQLRLERGRSLLHDTDLQVQLIADHVGYRNAGDFTRAFRRYYGITPRRYRQEALQRSDEWPDIQR